MRTEELVKPAIQWLESRPTLKKEQLSNPIFSLLRAKEEIDELIQAIHEGASREEIGSELVDVFNFIACAEWVLVREHEFTEEELIDEAAYKYRRNELKYPSIGYQNGTPAKEQLRTDANIWAFWQAYLGIPELGINPEYY